MTGRHFTLVEPVLLPTTAQHEPASCSNLQSAIQIRSYPSRVHRFARTACLLQREAQSRESGRVQPANARPSSKSVWLAQVPARPRHRPEQRGSGDGTGWQPPKTGKFAIYCRPGASVLSLAGGGGGREAKRLLSGGGAMKRPKRWMELRPGAWSLQLSRCLAARAKILLLIHRCLATASLSLQL